MSMDRSTLQAPVLAARGRSEEVAPGLPSIELKSPKRQDSDLTMRPTSSFSAPGGSPKAASSSQAPPPLVGSPKKDTGKPRQVPVPASEMRKADPEARSSTELHRKQQDHGRASEQETRLPVPVVRGKVAETKPAAAADDNAPQDPEATDEQRAKEMANLGDLGQPGAWVQVELESGWQDQSESEVKQIKDHVRGGETKFVIQARNAMYIIDWTDPQNRRQVNMGSKTGRRLRVVPRKGG